MPFNGAGQYVLPTPQYPAVPGTVILAEDYNQVLEDLAAALSSTLVRDGQAAATGTISLGSFKLTNVANGVNSGDAVNFGQVFTNPTFTATTPAGLQVTGTTASFTVTSFKVTAADADFSASTLVQLPDNTLVTGAVPLPSDSTFKIASRNFVQTVAFNTALPSQAGNAGKVPRTDGVNVAWWDLKTVGGQSIFGAGNITTVEIKARTVTGADTAIASDLQKVLTFTAGAPATLTLTAAATLGDGWYTTLRNGCAADWTVDPAAAELISGQSTAIVPAGYTALLKCNGVSFDLQWTRVRPAPSLAKLVQLTANTNYIVPPDVWFLRCYALGTGSAAVVATRTGASGGMAWGDIPVTPGDTVAFAITAGVATVTVNGVVMLTGGAAVTTTAGTASKHASVQNGGASAGANSTAAASSTAGPSSGSPVGPGVAAISGRSAGVGWGGISPAGGLAGGSGTGGPGIDGRGGRAISALLPSMEPLLSLLNGAPGMSGDRAGGDGGPGAGGGNTTGTNTAFGGNGGIGGGGGFSSNVNTATSGNGGFGASGGVGLGASGGAAGASGFGAGGGVDNLTGLTTPFGAAAFLYFNPL